MNLEQTIREQKLKEAADLQGRLDQLVRAGLMPTGNIATLKSSLTKMQAGIALHGKEVAVLNDLINSMLFIVLGDDAIFSKARAGAKATYQQTHEQVEDLDESAKVAAHLIKRYGDNVRKSHVRSAANDFGVGYVALAHAVRKKLGVNRLEEAKEKQEYDYEGDMAMSQLKSIIANSQRMHDSMSEDTNLPEWVQSKITLAEDYISTAANYLQGEMSEELKGNQHKIDANKNGKVDAHDFKLLRSKKKVAEETEQIDELSHDTLRSYRMKAKSIADHGGDQRTKGRELASRKSYGGRMAGIEKAKVMAKEEAEQIDELSTSTLQSYRKKARAQGNAIVDKMKMGGGDWSKDQKDTKTLRKRAAGAQASGKQLVKRGESLKTEEAEQIDELSKATMGRYINKAATKMGSQGVTAGLKIAADEKSSKNFKDMAKREKGISRAVNKLTKEDIDAVKKMNESYKTAFDSALIEYNIKSPSELGEEQRKEFFQFVDQEFKKGDN